MAVYSEFFIVCPLHIVIFHSYVKLPKGTGNILGYPGIHNQPAMIWRLNMGYIRHTSPEKKKCGGDNQDHRIDRIIRIEVMICTVFED